VIDQFLALQLVGKWFLINKANPKPNNEESCGYLTINADLTVKRGGRFVG
jgi:hypothetical protein